MSYARRAIAATACVCAGLALAGCGLNPLSGMISQTPSSTTTKSRASTSTATATSTAAAKPAAPARTKFAATPTPHTLDPLLAGGKWGYHSKKTVENRLSSGVTLALHENLELDEITDLTDEQSSALLKIFRNSSKVHGWIDAAGGNSGDATYTVEAIQASDDVGNDTPWVYATLRAGFGTRDGAKAIECFVYRVKTDRGLDMRPFMSTVLVGYTTSGGIIINPTRIRIR
jgi:hypothetical protein